MKPNTRFFAYALVGIAVLSSAEFRPQAVGPISGRVFEDFNGNGVFDTTVTFVNDGGAGVTPAAVDRGRSGIEVRAFDSAGVQAGATATTDAAGLYSIATTGAGPYRVEFTNLPAGYQPSAVATGVTGNASTVQFVPDGNVGNVNLAILDPANFCQNNPTLVTSCFVFGDNVTGSFNANPVLVSFPYSAGSNSTTNAASYFVPNTHQLMVPA
ncbi:MAG TPA: SdrD B-like domain-containing protein, partial [Vicinamibacterales bacterium]|nr:SdrD B-like domain-containing protein [Vicinamibacterales bacterium]